MGHSFRFIAAALAFGALTSQLLALEVAPVLTDINSNIFFTGPITIERVGFENNVVRKFTLHEGPAGGGSFVLAISNGENGMDVGPGANNPDVPNPTPVGDAIDIVNGGDGTMGNRLTNGNTFRFSVWMQQDPGNPIMKEPSVEPVLKFELWSEAQSTNGDFTAGRKPFADFGDRLWDTDINAPDAYYEGFGQSEASHVDLNNDGDVVSGDPVVVSLPPATGVQWVRVETTIVIDDDPDETGLGWDVAGQGFHVDAIEEVRATFFVGDFTGDPNALADGGAFFVDNALLEIFPDEATMLATPNPNPLPMAAVTGDYNDNGVVDAADYTVWRDHLGGSAAALANRSPSVTGFVKAADYDAWKTNFGNGASGLSAAIMAYAPAQTVPEPAAVVLVFMASVGAVLARRSR
jgi:hypothetical protein